MILISFGGTTTACVVVGFLSKSLLSHWFKKELEAYKAKVNHENATALENFKAELQKNSKHEDREFELEKIMNDYKGPFIHAIYDLQSRIFNIVERNLTHIYYRNGNEAEREYVLKNTTFVIAQFFAWNEIIRKEIHFIEFKLIEKTKELSDLQDKIYSLWQTDLYQDKFVVWAGEQRGIGEVMIENNNDKLTCIGYAKFLKVLSDEKEPLLSKLQDKIKTLVETEHFNFRRLIDIQNALIDTLGFLDPNFVRFPKDTRGYIVKITL